MGEIHGPFGALRGHYKPSPLRGHYKPSPLRGHYKRDIIYSFCSGIIQTGNARLYKTPTYYAQQLYAIHAGTHPLQVEIEGDLERNDVSATLSRDGRTVVLFVVNNTRSPRRVTLDLSAFGPLEKPVRIWTLMDTQRAHERDVTNSFDDPGRVRPVASSLSRPSPQFGYTFPPLSLTVMECRKR